MKRALVIVVAIAGFVGCPQPTFKGTDAQLADQLAAQLAEACPMASPDDEVERGRCAAALTDLALLRDNMADPFLWGQQPDAGIVQTADHVTRFTPLVWRRIYLSLYMFPAEHTVEALGDGRTLLRIAAKFRNKLDMGAYPYPFWHKFTKWQQYQLAHEVVFVIQNGKLLSALRSAEGTEDPTKQPEVLHEWGGQWTWTLGGETYPQAPLYTWLLSKDNPHRMALEDAYRDLEAALRQHQCMNCHQPDNVLNMGQLELFSFPNQALAGRHRIVAQLTGNTMPYPDPTRGIAMGIADAAERQKLLDLAKTFADLGDQALLFEGEHVTP
jgi:hypothetical protein